VKPKPGPLEQIRLPTGMVVDSRHRLLVASSNADLLYDQSTGGTVMALDPFTVDSIALAGTVNVQSFAGDLALARTEAWTTTSVVPDAEACGALVPGPLAVFGTRGSNTLNVLSLNPVTGELSCSGPGARCGIAVGTGVGDPLAVAIACGGGKARAFTGYLTAPSAGAWIGELDLSTLRVQNAMVGFGPIRSFAYDRDRDRLFMMGLATASPTPLRWVDLAGCSLGAPLGAGGCRVGSATLPGLPAGLELRAMALAHSASPGSPRAAGASVRAYLTARLYDTSAAAIVGFRNTDAGGLIIVVDLVENALGGVDPQVISAWPIGTGAQDIRVLPRLPGWAPARRDVVAVLTVDEGALWIYDDETHSLQAFRQCSTAGVCEPVTGGPILGHEPFGLAVDPDFAGSVARLWVGSYAQSFVTPIDVTLDPEVLATFAGGFHHRITGPTP
jgi:hypothetical protein